MVWMAGSGQHGLDGKIYFHDAREMEGHLSALHCRNIAAALAGIPTHALASRRRHQAKQQLRRGARERLHEARGYTPHLWAAATSAASSASQFGSPTHDGLAEEMEKWRTFASAEVLCSTARKKFFAAQRRVVDSLLRGQQLATSAESDMPPVLAHPDTMALALEKKKLTVLRGRLQFLVGDFDVYDMAAQLLARASPGCTRGAGGRGSHSTVGTPSQPPSYFDSLFLLMLPERAPTLITNATIMAAAATAAKTELPPAAASAEFWSSGLPGRVMQLFFALMQLYELADEEIKDCGDGDDGEDEEGDGDGGGGGGCDNSPRRHRRAAKARAQRLLEAAIVLADALVRYCGGPVLMYSELASLAFVIWRFRDAFEDDEHLLKSIGIGSGGGGAATAISRTVTPAFKAAITSPAMLCRVAQRVAVTRSPHCLRRMLKMGNLVLAQMETEPPLPLRVKVSIAGLAAQALACAVARLRAGDSRYRVLNAVRSEAAAALEQKRQRIEVTMSRRQALAQDAAGDTVLDINKRMVGALPEMLQHVWREAERRCKSGGGTGGGGGEGGREEDGAEGAHGMVELGRGGGNNERLSVRHSLGRLLLSLDRRHGGQVIATGPGTVSYTVAVVAALNYVSWLSMGTLGRIVNGIDGGGGGGGGGGRAGDAAPYVRDRTTVAAAEAAALADAESVFDRRGGGMGLGPVVMTPYAEWASEQSDGGGGGGGTTGAAASAASHVEMDVRASEPYFWKLWYLAIKAELGARITVDGSELSGDRWLFFARNLQRRLDDSGAALLCPVPVAGSAATEVAVTALAKFRSAWLNPKRNLVVVPVVLPILVDPSQADPLAAFVDKLRDALMMWQTGRRAGTAGDSGSEAEYDTCNNECDGGKRQQHGTISNVVKPSDGVASCRRAATAATSNAVSNTGLKGPCGPCGPNSSPISGRGSGSCEGNRKSAVAAKATTENENGATASATAGHIRTNWRLRRALVVNWALSSWLGLIESRQTKLVSDPAMDDDGEQDDGYSNYYANSNWEWILDHALGTTSDIRRLVSERLGLFVLESKGDGADGDTAAAAAAGVQRGTRI